MIPRATLNEIKRQIARRGLRYQQIGSAARAVLATWPQATTQLSHPKQFVSSVLAGAITQGWGVQAVWETLRNLGIITEMPAEVIEARRELERHERNPRSTRYWRQQVRDLKRQLARAGCANPDSRSPNPVIKEVPMLSREVLRFWSLQRHPFSREVRTPEDLWPGRQVKRSTDLLIEAVEDASFVRLAGPRGAGKSLVAQAALWQLRKRPDVIVALPDPAETPYLEAPHLSAALLQAVGRWAKPSVEVYPMRPNRVTRSLQRNALLIQARDAGKKIVLWIDEGHRLGAPTLYALKGLLEALDRDFKRIPLAIVLISKDDEDILIDPHGRVLEEVGHRMETVRLRPMNGDVPDYVQFKLRRAGGEPARIITTRALKAVGESCAWPLDANVLVSRLLLRGYEDKERPIDVETVEAAEQSLAATGGG